MNRREFAQRTALQAGAAASSLLAATAPMVRAADPPAKKPERSPHAEALELVFHKAADRIRAVDGEDWWHDVKERTWAVQRPFSPGTIDSTHWFTVTYRIGGKQAAAWRVDTRAGTVTEIKSEEGKQ